MTNNLEFQEFPKMARFSRDIVITEKIDGTNASVIITEDGDLFAGSRTKYITPQDDNAGFARWAYGNKNELLKLGAGRHFGEWWGSGIQRGYGMTKGDKRFSMFNIGRWALYGSTAKQIITADPRVIKFQDFLPEGILLVPELYRGVFCTNTIDAVLEDLKITGSYAAKGFMRPEGIVIFHIAGNVGFKKTIEKDNIPKSLA